MGAARSHCVLGGQVAPVEVDRRVDRLHHGVRPAAPPAHIALEVVSPLIRSSSSPLPTPAGPAIRACCGFATSAAALTDAERADLGAARRHAQARRRRRGPDGAAAPRRRRPDHARRLRTAPGGELRGHLARACRAGETPLLDAPARRGQVDVMLVATGRNNPEAIERFARDVARPELRTFVDPQGSRPAAAMNRARRPVTGDPRPRRRRDRRLLGGADWASPERRSINRWPRPSERADAPEPAPPLRDPARRRLPQLRLHVAADDRGGRDAVSPGAQGPALVIRPADLQRTAPRPELFARLIGADADGVALVPAASYGLATAAGNLPLRAGQRVLARRGPVPVERRPLAGPRGRDRRHGRDGAARPRRRPDRRAAGGDRRPHRGRRLRPLPLDRRGAVDLRSAPRRGRPAPPGLVLDLTRFAGALPFDVAAVRPDFVVAACYKWLLGPYATGFLWVAPERRDGRPLEQHWSAAAAPRTSPASSTTGAYAPAPGASTWARPRTSRCCRWSRRRSPADPGGGDPGDPRWRHRWNLAARAAPLGLVAGDPARRAGHFLRAGPPRTGHPQTCRTGWRGRGVRQPPGREPAGDPAPLERRRRRRPADRRPRRRLRRVNQHCRRAHYTTPLR